MKNFPFESYAKAVALDRFGVIAPLVTRALTSDEFSQEFERIVGSLHKFESNGEIVKISERTAHRWFSWHQHGRFNDQGQPLSGPGLDSLQPLRRSDCGLAR